ncbi:5' nucleotidase, NT5C type [Virgibacillus ainsalahensis]
MRFGFDIDDTLINLREHAFNIYKEKLNKHVSRDDFLELRRVEIHELFGLSEEQGKEMWKDSMEEVYYTTCLPFPGAIEMLDELKEQGHEIFYITARPKGHGERTKKWMKEQGFPIRDDRFFSGMKDNEKVHIIKDLQLDYYVDDKPVVLETLTDQPTSLFIKDQSYNQEMINLPRITDWADFKKLIKK